MWELQDRDHILRRKLLNVTSSVFSWGSEDFHRAAPYNERQKLEKREVLTRGSQQAKRCNIQLALRHILSNRRNIFTVGKVMCKYVTKMIDRVSKTE